MITLRNDTARILTVGDFGSVQPTKTLNSWFYDPKFTVTADDEEISPILYYDRALISPGSPVTVEIPIRSFMAVPNGERTTYPYECLVYFVSGKGKLWFNVDTEPIDASRIMLLNSTDAAGFNAVIDWSIARRFTVAAVDADADVIINCNYTMNTRGSML